MSSSHHGAIIINHPAAPEVKQSCVHYFVVVRRLDEDGVVQEFSVAELFGGQKGVLVGVPGAFTPTCSSVHLPEYVDKSAGLAAKVTHDERICMCCALE